MRTMGPGITWILFVVISSLALLQLSPRGNVAAPAPIDPSPLKEPLQQSVHTELGLEIAINSDGSQFVATSTEPDYTAAIVHLDSHLASKTIVPVKGGGYPRRYRWSKDDKMIAYACATSDSEESPPHDILLLIDGKTGKEIRELLGHQSEVLDMAFSPDGKLLASAGHDATVRLWNPSNGRPVRVLNGHSEAIIAVAFSHDGKRLASADWEKLRLWDVNSGKLLKELKHEGVIYAIDLHPRKDLVAIGMSDGRLNNPSPAYNIELWDIRNSKEFKLVGTLHVPTRLIRSVAFHPAGHHVAAGTNEGIVYIWDLKTQKILYTLKHRLLSENGHAESLHIRRITFNADGRYLAVATEDLGVGPKVIIWNLSGRKK